MCFPVLHGCFINASLVFVAVMLIRNLGNLQGARTTVTWVWLSGSSLKPLAMSPVRAGNCLVCTGLPSTVFSMQLPTVRRNQAHTAFLSGYFRLMSHLGRVLALPEGGRGHADGILASFHSQLSPSGPGMGYAVNGPSKSQFSRQLCMDNLG